VEVVILAPALGLFLALIIAGGRIAVAHQAVEASAAEAARSASIARTQGQAQALASAAALLSLADQSTRCVSTQVTPASVGATVTCQVDIAGLLPGLPGSMSITATVRSPLDTYRER
jgi:Flp pilus assembly protein TadG